MRPCVTSSISSPTGPRRSSTGPGASTACRPSGSGSGNAAPRRRGIMGRCRDAMASAPCSPASSAWVPATSPAGCASATNCSPITRGISPISPARRSAWKRSFPMPGGSLPVWSSSWADGSISNRLIRRGCGMPRARSANTPAWELMPLPARGSGRLTRHSASISAPCR